MNTSNPYDDQQYRDLVIDAYYKLFKRVLIPTPDTVMTVKRINENGKEESHSLVYENGEFNFDLLDRDDFFNNKITGVEVQTVFASVHLFDKSRKKRIKVLASKVWKYFWNCVHHNIILVYVEIYDDGTPTGNIMFINGTDIKANVNLTDYIILNSKKVNHPTFWYSILEKTPIITYNIFENKIEKNILNISVSEPILKNYWKNGIKNYSIPVDSFNSFDEIHFQKYDNNLVKINDVFILNKDKFNLIKEQCKLMYSKQGNYYLIPLYILENVLCN